MKTDSTKPEDPSSAPATIRMGLLIANPSAAPESPAKEFRSEITVGISAPPIRITNITPKARPIAISGTSRPTCRGMRVRATTSSTPAPSTDRFTMFCPG